MNPVDGVSPDLIGNGVVIDSHPRSIVVRGCIPDIPVIQVIAVAKIEHVVADSRGDIEPKSRRKKEKRRIFDDHGGVDVYRRRTADIDANADTYVGCVCQGSDPEDNRTTENNFSHIKRSFRFFVLSLIT